MSHGGAEGSADAGVLVVVAVVDVEEVVSDGAFVVGTMEVEREDWAA